MNVLRDGSSHSIVEISERTGVSRQTVSKAMDHFSELGLVINTGKGDSTGNGGKKPNLFQLSSRPKLLVIQFRVNENCVILYDLTCREISYSTIETNLTEPFDFYYYLEKIKQMSEQIFAQTKISAEDLYGVVVITPGPVIDHAFVHYNPFRKQWGLDIPVKEEFQKIFPTAKFVYVENIGKLAGLGTITEHAEAYQSRRVVTVYTYEGINGCFFDHGKIVDGANSIIGEFGHMILQPDSPTQCICGNHGCFESVVRSSTIHERIQRSSDINGFLKFAGKPLSEIIFEDIVKGYEAGIRCCQNELKTLAAYFAQAFLNISLVYDPDIFVIEGYYSCFNKAFESLILEYLSNFSLLTPDRYFHIAADHIPLEKLEVSGAITALKEHFFSDQTIYE